VLYRCAFCCEVENGLRRKKKRTKRATEPSLESDRENTKRERSFAPESITRHLSVLSASFSRALCARVWSGSKPKRVQAGRKTSRLKIRKNHALRCEIGSRVRAPRGDDANVKTYKKPPQTHLQFPLVLLLHHYRYLEQ